MRTLYWIYLISLSFQLVGCALLSHRPEEELSEDPIVAVARRYRDPAMSPENELERSSEAEIVEVARANGELIVGMQTGDVLAVWGRPAEIETAGTPGAGYEKWIYYEGLSGRLGLGLARTVYFEKGAVAGWDRLKN